MEGKLLLGLGVLVLLQWNPTVGCDCSSCGKTYAPPPPETYVPCTTDKDCPTAGTGCKIPRGKGMCSKACTSDSDCPSPGACVSVSGSAAFCARLTTLSAEPPCDVNAVLRVAVYTAVSGTDAGPDPERLACVPQDLACGDQYCARGETSTTCPTDCEYPVCFEQFDCESNTCLAVGSPADAGLVYSRLCSRNCSSSGDCPSRSGFAGVCEAGVNPSGSVCLQSCAGAGSDAQCLPHERCAMGKSPAVFVCVPDSSAL